MKNVIATPISSKNFTYSANKGKRGGTFTIERSTLDAIGGMQRLYNDSLDVGIELLSARTGNVATFVMVAECRDRENEISHWILSPVMSSVERNRNLHFVNIHVYNT